MFKWLLDNSLRNRLLVIIGALVLVSLQTGMVLIGFGDGSYQRMVTGVALVLAVYLDIVYRKRIK